MDHVDGPHSKSQPDQELWSELKRGKQDALQTLFLRYHDSLYKYGLAVCSRKSMIEDCLQELFVQLWEKRSSLSKVEKVKGYLWISFRRRLMNQLKDRRAESQFFIPFLPDMKRESSIESTIIQQEQRAFNHETLHRVVESLSDREREVLFLKYYEGMSYGEIEQILEIEYQTARNYAYRAITRLRDELDKEEVQIVLSQLFCFGF